VTWEIKLRAGMKFTTASRSGRGCEVDFDMMIAQKPGVLSLVWDPMPKSMSPIPARVSSGSAQAAAGPFSHHQ